MKVEKNVYSNKLGVNLMVYLSEEDNVIGINPCAPNTRIKILVISQEVDSSKKRIYENEYWIKNDANKFVYAFKYAFRDSVNKFSLDDEANKMFEAINAKDDIRSNAGDLKIKVDVVLDVDKAKQTVNELLESLKFKVSN